MRSSRIAIPKLPKVHSARRSTLYFNHCPRAGRKVGPSHAGLQQNDNTLGDINQKGNSICLEFPWFFFPLLISCLLSFLLLQKERRAEAK